MVLPLPAAADGSLAEPVLLWCLRGSALVVIETRRHRVDAGQALWIPSGSRIGVEVRRDDVVVPVPGLRCGDAVRPTLVEVPAGWTPWLLRAFGEALVYLDGDSGVDEIEALLAAAVPERAIPQPPVFPVSTELQALASAIAMDPAISVSDHIGRHLPGWTSRTLQRRFTAETGLTPQRWARRQRLAVAAEMLAGGAEVEAVAHRVGYDTSSGFSRQFESVTGVTPGRWRGQVAASFVTTLRPAEIDAALSPPPQRTWLRANGAHVAVWVAHGDATIRVGTQETRYTRGEAVVLPAGMPNSIRLGPGALVLPLGYRSGRTIAVGAPLHPARIVQDDELDLIRAMVAAYTPLRHHGADEWEGFDRVLTASQTATADEDDRTVAALASAIALGDVPEESLAGCAMRLGIAERSLSRIVNARTGMTFAQWLRVSRMSRARVQLHGGEAASTVSRRLGYAHLPAFSRAFREVHGTSPGAVPQAGPRDRRTA